MPALRRQWFALAYVVVLAIGLTCPNLGSQGGTLRLEVLRPWCIAGIFLCAGLVLPGRRLAAAIGSWRAHLLIQSICFVLAPLAGLIVAWLAHLCGLPVSVQTGLIILGCLPTTISSCVVITGLAGGDQGIALVNSVLGNLLGLIITPLLITLLIGHTCNSPIAGVIAQLTLLAVVPVLLGQLARWPLGDRLDRGRAQFGVISGGLLLLVLLGIFSDLAGLGLASEVLPVAVLSLVLFAILLVAAWALACRFVRRARIAIAATASQKAIALGIPLISLLFANDPVLPMLLLPVIIYHIVQSLASSLLAGWTSARPA